MTIRQTPQADKFKQQLRDSLQRETLNSHAVKIAPHANVTPVAIKTRWSTSLRAARSNRSCSPRKVKSASLTSVRIRRLEQKVETRVDVSLARELRILCSFRFDSAPGGQGNGRTGLFRSSHN